MQGRTFKSVTKNNKNVSVLSADATPNIKNRKEIMKKMTALLRSEGYGSNEFGGTFKDTSTKYKKGAK
jgi:hypothetical protein